MASQVNTKIYKRRLLLGERIVKNRPNHTRIHFDHPYTKPPPLINPHGLSCLMPPKASVPVDEIHQLLDSELTGEFTCIDLNNDPDLAAQEVVGNVTSEALCEKETIPIPVPVESTTLPRNKEKSRNNQSLLLPRSEFDNLVKSSLKDLKELTEYPGPTKLVEVVMKLSMFGTSTEKITDWFGDNPVISDKLNTTLKDFYTNNHKVIVDIECVKMVTSYFKYLAPDVHQNLNDREMLFIGTEFLRRFILQARIYLGKQYALRENDTDSGKTESPLKSYSKMTKEEEILYYVAGSTINSISKKHESKSEFLDAVCYKGGVPKNEMSSKITLLSDWTLRMNRGGLIFVNEATYMLFHHINVIAEPFYSTGFGDCNNDRKERAKKLIFENTTVVKKWDDLLKHLTHLDKKKLLVKLVDSFLNLRGKALAIYYKTKYQIAAKENLKSKPCLRKALKKGQTKSV